MKIHPEIKNACIEILERSHNSGMATKKKMADLDQVIQWFEKPEEDLLFSFNLTFSRFGESLNFDIEHDGANLKVEQYNTSNEGSGSDHNTPYEYSNNWDGEKTERGELSSWLNNAKDVLSHSDNEDAEVEIHISVEED